MSKFTLAAVVLSTATSSTFAQSGAPAITYRTIAFTGQQVDGINGDAHYTGFSTPRISQNGHISFLGGIFGNDADPASTAVFAMHNDGTTRLVAREGERSPTGAFWRRLSNAYINSAGEVALAGQIEIGGYPSGADSIWSEGGGGGLRPIAIEGRPTPDRRGDEVFGALPTEFRFNNAGDIAFASSTFGTKIPGTVAPSLWSESGGEGLRRVITRYDVSPGIDGLIDSMKAPALNDLGEMVFPASLTSFGIGDPRDVIYRESHELGMQPVVHDFQYLPDYDVTLSSLYSDAAVAINNRGDAIFTADIRTSPSGRPDDALWIQTHDSGLELIARRGDLVPGFEFQFGDFDLPLISANGHIAFHSGLIGAGIGSPNGSSIWLSDDSGSLRLVAQEGVTPAGTTGQVEFDEFDDINTSFEMSINAHGQIAFLADLRGNDVTSQNDLGLWATDLAGSLHLIARTGDLFDVNPDPAIEDLREIKSIEFHGGSGGEDGYGVTLNDRGELVMKLQFVGSEPTFGLYVVSIPEPGTVAAASIALLTARRRRLDA